MPAWSNSPRTLTQMLREWDDATLAGLLLTRPDLAFPPPSDLTQIASRATTRHSVSSALDTLNAFELEVARRASASTAGFPADVHGTALAAGLDEVAALDALQRLQRLALVWGPATSLRPVRAMSALLAGPGTAAGARAEAATVPAAHPPTFSDAPRQPPSLVDKVAAGSAFELVRRVEVLVEHCDHLPLRLSRAGGFASREVKVIAALLDVPAAVATLHLEVAEKAGLLGLAAHDGNEVLLPSTAFDGWLDRPLADQWAVLAASWLDAHDGGGPRWLKRLCLEAFGDPAEGRVLSASELRTWVAWQRPRLAVGTDRQVATFLDQGSWVGVTGLGAVASFAPHLRHARPPAHRDEADHDSSTLARHLPMRSEHVLVQADLTAIAPGPLTAAASRELGTLADVESRGGATVYRFTAESLGRGLDAGWDAEEILSVLRSRSRTALPQPLRYLVHDLARRRTEAGASSKPAAKQPAPPRGVPRHGPGESSAADLLPPAAATAIVAGLRQAESTSPHRGAPGLRTPEPRVAPVDALRQAVETGEVVWISLVDARGATSERLVRAVDVADGQLLAQDARYGDDIAVPVRRISAAHIVRNGK